MSTRTMEVDLPRLADDPERIYRIRIAVPNSVRPVYPVIRRPKCGQLFMHLDGEVRTADWDYEYVHGLIVQRVDDWKWPSWLLADWIFCDTSGNWYAADAEPEYRPDWADWDYSRLGTRILLNRLLDFSPPPCVNWQESKRRRPAAG